MLSQCDGCMPHGATWIPINFSETSISMFTECKHRLYDVAGYRVRQYATVSVYAANTNFENSGLKHFYSCIHVHRKKSPKRGEGEFGLGSGLAKEANLASLFCRVGGACLFASVGN